MNQRTPRSEDGQALLILTLSMVVFLVVAGLAIDGGTVFLQRRRLQNAADAAAREGARQMYRWQIYAAFPEYPYPRAEEGERAVLAAIHGMAEENGVPDTDGVPGNHVNDNITAYYVDSQGTRIPGSTAALGEVGAPAWYDDCAQNRCRPNGVGTCCGVQVVVNDEFSTALVRLTGPAVAPIEAESAGVFRVSEAYGAAGNSAAWAMGTGCGNDQLYMSGDSAYVEGTAHSNDGVTIIGDKSTVEHLEYVNTGSHIAEKVDVWSTDILDAPVDANLPFTTTYYYTYTQLNGTHHAGGWTVGSSQTGVHYVSGDMLINTEDVTLTGVYYVEGDFDATGAKFGLIDATIVATGHIFIQANSPPISPWVDDPWGLSLYSAKVDRPPPCDCADGFGISIRGDHGTNPGVFYAPDSRVCITANKNDVAGGGIFADSIDVRGDAWRLEPWRPEGGGVGELERIVLVR